MARAKQIVWLIVALLFVILAATVVYNLLFDDRGERLEAWIRQSAATIPDDPYTDYQKYTTFPDRDFFVQYTGRKWLIAAGDESAFEKRARDVRKYLEGAHIEVIAVDTDTDIDEPGIDAMAKVLLRWRMPGGTLMNLGMELKAVETETSWEAASVKVYNAGEVINFMKDNALKVLEFNRNR